MIVAQVGASMEAGDMSQESEVSPFDSGSIKSPVQ